jgi:hypothetical protein
MLMRIKTNKGQNKKGNYQRGYKPGMLDEAFRQIVGHYPTSRKTTVKDKKGNYWTGKLR